MNAVFWVVILRFQTGPEDGSDNFSRNVKAFRLLVAVNAVPRSQNLVTLMMEAIISSETSVTTRATRHNIPEDGIGLCEENADTRSWL
jgi:hypothetical protein